MEVGLILVMVLEETKIVSWVSDTASVLDSVSRWMLDIDVESTMEILLEIEFVLWRSVTLPVHKKDF